MLSKLVEFSAKVMLTLRYRPDSDASTTMQQDNVAAVRVRADDAVGLGTLFGVEGAALSLAGSVVPVAYNVRRNVLGAALLGPRVLLP